MYMYMYIALVCSHVHDDRHKHKIISLHFTYIMQFLKLDDVGDQMRLHKWHIQHRGSLMARLLHHTIDHAREREMEERGGEKEGEEGEEEMEDLEGEGEGEEEKSIETEFDSMIAVDVTK